MKIVLVLLLLVTTTTRAFLGPQPVRRLTKTRPTSTTALQTYMTDELENQLDTIGHKLKLQLYDANTGVFGFESKDPAYGIENIHCKVHFDPSLGLELTEIAHSETDHRGLVMVSDVEGNARHETPIHIGDTIIGVFIPGTEFRESTTGFDYDDTVDVITRAKQHAMDTGNDSITLELNRLVRRATVRVEIVGDDGETVVNTIEDAKAGDNLRLLLMHHHVNLYDPKTPRLDQPHLTGDCGGDGVCGTCLISILEGMEHLNNVGPQEQTILQSVHRPTWRAACKTVIGADNEPGATLRVRLHPQSVPPPATKLSP